MLESNKEEETVADLGHRDFEAVEEGAAPHYSTRVERDVVERRQVLHQVMNPFHFHHTVAQRLGTQAVLGEWGEGVCV